MDGGKDASSWRVRKKAVLCGKKHVCSSRGRKNMFLDGGDKRQFLDRAI